MLIAKLMSNKITRQQACQKSHQWHHCYTCLRSCWKCHSSPQWCQRFSGSSLEDVQTKIKETNGFGTVWNDGIEPNIIGLTNMILDLRVELKFLRCSSVSSAWSANVNFLRPSSNLPVLFAKQVLGWSLKACGPVCGCSVRLPSTWRIIPLNNPG